MSHFVPLFFWICPWQSHSWISQLRSYMLSWRYSCHSEKRNVVMTKSMLFELNVWHMQRCYCGVATNVVYELPMYRCLWMQKSHSMIIIYRRYTGPWELQCSRNTRCSISISPHFKCSSMQLKKRSIVTTFRFLECNTFDTTGEKLMPDQCFS